MTPPRIAIVNDDPAFLDLIQDLVADSRKYETCIIQHGMGAITHLTELSPDVIILDVRLEYARLGYHLLEAIRRNSQLHTTPVIICTADRGFLEDYEQLLRELDCDWLEKPFEIDDLLTKLDHTISNHGTST